MEQSSAGDSLFGEILTERFLVYLALNLCLISAVYFYCGWKKPPSAPARGGEKSAAKQPSEMKPVSKIKPPKDESRKKEPEEKMEKSHKTHKSKKHKKNKAKKEKEKEVDFEERKADDGRDKVDESKGKSKKDKKDKKDKPEKPEKPEKKASKLVPMKKALGKKEREIAKGAKRKKGDYPTMDDVVSDWDSNKDEDKPEDMEGTISKGPEEDKKE